MIYNHNERRYKYEICVELNTMEFAKIPGFGVEKVELEFTGFWDWFVAFNNINTLWTAQSSYIYVQLLFIVGSIITLYHAFKNGGRFKHLWFGILLHGLMVELLSYNLPNVDNFWHSQTPIIFLGRRLPFYIIILYIVFYYTATVAVDKLKLPKWSEPFAIGLVAVLIDYPYDVIGARFMHWTWHDTDPNVSDKHYYVPWTSFYFHTTFAASFTFWFHFTRRIAFGKSEKWQSDKSYIKEWICTIISGFLGVPGGVLFFIPIYHPLHDFFNIHTEVAFFFLFTICVSIIWLSLPINSESVVKTSKRYTDYAILLYLVIYYMVFICIALFIDPASEISIGLHEQIGPCNENTSTYSILGSTIYKRKYLCPTDYDETYFGWSCLPNEKPPKDGAHWYTICGTPWTNKVEYIAILTAIAVLGISFFTKVFLLGYYEEKLQIDRKETLRKLKVKSN